jgi:ribulose-phosphate 3-epimerase
MRDNMPNLSLDDVRSGPRVLPSILSADFARLADAMEIVTAEGACVLHLDVMDGHFVPNITFGPPLVAAVRRASAAFLDCHLMIEEPVRYAPAFHAAGADLITLHAELFANPIPALETVRSLGIPVGLAINPDTPLERVEDALPSLDLLVVMSVFPGFGGQSFREEAWRKIHRAKEIRDRDRLGFLIEVDGGVGEENAAALARAGVDWLVAGNAVYGAPNAGQAYRRLVSLTRSAP